MPPYTALTTLAQRVDGEGTANDGEYSNNHKLRQRIGGWQKGELFA